MLTTGHIIQGRYYDSVTLMNIAGKITELDGVQEAAVVMGTPENLAILETAGLLVAEFAEAGSADLLISLKVESGEIAARVVEQVVEELARTRERDEGTTDFQPRSVEGALETVPDANLALISVAGRFAAAQARRALELGLHVMLFSDNVPLEEEIELKQLGQQQELLVMGPDCGSAIINGVPLGFANAVDRGDIGIVAASGTGLQEVSCFIHNAGLGISQAIGTGGRDLSREVGGATSLAALKALGEDPATHTIVLISKPPHPEVAAEIERVCAEIPKPVVTLFLGSPRIVKGFPLFTLEDAARAAVAITRNHDPDSVAGEIEQSDHELKQTAARLQSELEPARLHLRGLFCGGTFCTEAQVVLSEKISPLHSNVPTGGALQLDDALASVGHTVVDLGDDDFTVGRPHPMIDYTLRNQRILAEAANPTTAVILLDVVLGYGANPDPVAELREVLIQGQVAVVCSVTGTDRDPQQRGWVVAALRELGVEVMPTNAAACRLAGEIIQLQEDTSCR